MLEEARTDDRVVHAYDHYVNPQWVRFLDILRMNVTYHLCRGAELHTTDGRVILDFISGYCVHNIGHNHSRLVEALKAELDAAGPAMLQSHVSDLAGSWPRGSAGRRAAAWRRRSSPAPAAKASRP